MLKKIDYSQISLTESRVMCSVEETIRFYDAIPLENILKYLREDAGLPAPGSRYGGWFARSRGVFLIGQWISAFSRMYAFTSQEKFREKAITLFSEFQKCCLLLENTPNAVFTPNSHYDIEKLLRAICDLKLCCGYDSAADWLPGLLSFAEQFLTKDNLFGNNLNEWYTMSEALYLVYTTFGLEKAQELGKRWEYTDFWELFYRDADPFSRRPEAGLYSEFCHAYSHVNSFNGCAMAYELTKDPRYLLALRRFYRFMQSEEVMATGGYGPNYEHIMPKYRIIDALRTGHDSFETQCNTYAAFRLSDYLTRFTGEASFGNWTESLIFNAAIATLPMTSDGKVVYYSDYNMYGAEKKNREDPWTCCTGTRPLLMLELPRLIYYEESASSGCPGLCISQFIPSVLRTELCGTAVSLEQKTAFPLDDTVFFSLSLSKPAAFSLKFRLPPWLSGRPQLSVNGLPVSAPADSSGWLVLSRPWNDGDQITLTLPQTLWLHALDTVKNGPSAFLHGPVVLAASYTGPQTPNDHMDIRGLIPRMRPIPGHALHYSVEGTDSITFKPFYEYAEHERYFLYHDTSAHATDRTRFAGGTIC